MNNRNNSIIALVCGVIAVLLSVYDSDSGTASLAIEQKKTMEEAYDVELLKTIETVFFDCTNQKISFIEEISSDLQGTLLKATSDNNEEYYLRISKSSLLQEIRKDSPEGEILYQINY